MIHKFRMELYIEPQESKQIKPLKKIISFIGIFPHIDQTMTTQQKPVRSRKVQSNSVECPISKNLAGHILHSHGTWSIQQFFFFFDTVAKYMFNAKTKFPRACLLGLDDVCLCWPLDSPLSSPIFPSLSEHTQTHPGKLQLVLGVVG